MSKSKVKFKKIPRFKIGDCILYDGKVIFKIIKITSRHYICDVIYVSPNSGYPADEPKDSWEIQYADIYGELITNVKIYKLLYT